MKAQAISSFCKKNYNKIPRYVFLAFIFLFCFVPLFSLLFRIGSGDLSFIFQDSNFYSALGITLAYSAIAALLAVVCAIGCAYLLNKSTLRLKNVFVLLLTLPMLVPTLSIGLGTRTLFGVNGFLDKFFHIQIDGLGMLDLIVGSFVVAFSPVFLIIYDALRYESKSHYDAAKILGVSEAKQFFRITLPYLKVPAISAFFAGMSLVFSDYGVPMEVAGKLKTLPMYLYEQVFSTFQYGRAAIVGLFLLIPAVISFVFDIFMKDDSINETNSQMLRPKRKFNVISAVILIVFAFVLFLPQLCFVILAFVKAYPGDISFTWNNFKKIGLSTAGISIQTAIKNSLLMSIFTGIIGTIIAYLTAYYTTRMSGKMGRVLHMFSVASIAIPGIVLGIGYIFIFKGTNGFFYGTMIILIVVNIIHFFGSPYLLAKNCLTKINKDYEIVGETIGVSRFVILARVLIPNSISTMLEMFTYYFVNSMVTISAVGFLCSFSNQPLSIMISTFDKSSNYEMQAVVSVIILFINVVIKMGLIVLNNRINVKKESIKEDTIMEPLTRYQFDLLTYIDKNGKKKYSQRNLADMLTISLGTINKTIVELQELNYLQIDTNNEMSITEIGYKALEPYRVKRAIILAAGFGSRLAPVTLDTPKPLVEVNGKRIIDTLLDSLIEKGISDIYIVRGYKKDKFDVLLEKYPTIHFVDNELFNVTNNISSLIKAVNYIDRCYICEADL
ncbi:MAG: ABC transporter permease subunit, partial [Anaeroplasmataceae bacterium]|nr:ABC transporter permease subunit [Anaeroplasmataceae bacterium]